MSKYISLKFGLEIWSSKVYGKGWRSKGCFG